MGFSVEEIHGRIVQILQEEIPKYGNLPKLADKVNLEYQRLWDLLNGRRGKKEMPVDIVAHFIYHLDYSAIWILFGIEPAKKPLKKQ